jgi:hypothetical protein
MWIDIIRTRLFYHDPTPTGLRVSRTEESDAKELKDSLQTQTLSPVFPLLPPVHQMTSGKNIGAFAHASQI